MKRDANWLKYISLDQRRYAGKYVVIVRGKFIGASRDLVKLISRARKTDPKSRPFVAWIRDPKKLYVL